MMTLFEKSFLHALMITGFVFIMMLVIEYINVLTKGLWQRELHSSRVKQYLLASFLGSTPGCLGAFATVALYSHRVITIGALVAAMIATSGDESFVMLSMFPKKAMFLFLILFVIGIAGGLLTDLLFGKRAINQSVCPQRFEFHEEETCQGILPWDAIRQQWEHCSMARGVLSITLMLFIFAIVTGRLGPPVWNWIRVTLLLASLVAVFIVSTVPEHFLEEHLWGHIAKVHVPRVFLWTLGALFLMHILVDQLHLEGWMQSNRLFLLLAACLIGIIPESGPHLIFTTLFAKSAIPFSILLASSIVQDGHGMLPLLAESRIDFIKVKGINFFVGLSVGLIGYWEGW